MGSERASIWDLWRQGDASPLTCDECFRLLEALADLAAQGADPAFLRAALRRHLRRCPDCRRHHLRRLAELERWIAEIK